MGAELSSRKEWEEKKRKKKGVVVVETEKKEDGRLFVGEEKRGREKGGRGRRLTYSFTKNF